MKMAVRMDCSIESELVDSSFFNLTLHNTYLTAAHFHHVLSLNAVVDFDPNPRWLPQEDWMPYAGGVIPITTEM